VAGGGAGAGGPNHRFLRGRASAGSSLSRRARATPRRPPERTATCAVELASRKFSPHSQIQSTRTRRYCGRGAGRARGARVRERTKEPQLASLSETHRQIARLHRVDAPVVLYPPHFPVHVRRRGPDLGVHLHLRRGDARGRGERGPRGNGKRQFGGGRDFSRRGRPPRRGDVAARPLRPDLCVGGIYTHVHAIRGDSEGGREGGRRSDPGWGRGGERAQRGGGRTRHRRGGGEQGRRVHATGGRGRHCRRQKGGAGGAVWGKGEKKGKGFV
jgi:hypothetical protein